MQILLLKNYFPALLEDMSEFNPDIYKIALAYTDIEKFLKDLNYLYASRKSGRPDQ